MNKEHGKKGKSAIRALSRYGVPVILMAVFLLSLYRVAVLFIRQGDGSSVGQSAEARGDITLRYKPEYEIVSRKSVSIWEAGTVFEHGRPAYFYAVMPEINVVPVVEIGGSTGADLIGTIQISVSLSAVNDSGEELWVSGIGRQRSEEFRLSGKDRSDAGELRYTGGKTVLQFPELYEMARGFSEELQVPRVTHRVNVTARLSISGTVDGLQVDKSYTDTLSMSADENSFTVEDEENTGFEDIIAAGTPQGDNEPGAYTAVDYWIRILISLLSLLLFLVSIKLTKKNGTREHRRYREWITEGRVEKLDKPEIRVFSLAGLVDLAIDLEKRVIYDSSESKYYLIEDTLIYVYDPEREEDGRPEKRSRLGSLLVKSGLIKPEQLEIGLMYQRNFGGKLGESLITLGFIDDVTLYSALAAQAGVTFLQLGSLPDDVLDLSLLAKLTPARARVLEAVPVGVRQDGKLVVACGAPARKGLKDALEELFATDVEIVAAVPSEVYKFIDSMEPDTDRGGMPLYIADPEKSAEQNTLSNEEISDFRFSYRQGSFRIRLFLKAVGCARSPTFSPAPDEDIFRWIVNNGYMDGESAHLLASMKSACESMGMSRSRSLEVPSILEVLQKANYLPGDIASAVKSMEPDDDQKLDQYLTTNYITSPGTIQKIRSLLAVLRKLLINYR